MTADAAAVTTRHYGEPTRHLLDDVSGEAALMDSLLQGRILDRWKVWETANALRLPSQGTFVVIAPEVPALGAVALPAIESKLSSLDAYSAWRVLPELQVGILRG